MDPRLRRRTWAHAIERVLLDADLWIAARLNTRPLAEHALSTAAWAGRVWHHAYTTARHQLYGPGRGLIVIITRQKERPDA